MKREPENERSPSSVARFLFVCALLPSAMLACERPAEPEPQPRKQTAQAASAAPAVLYLPDDYAQLAQQPVTPPARRRCPEEMVLIRSSFCIDRYEVSLVDQAQSRVLSPHYPPTRRSVGELFARFQRTPARAQGPLQQLLPLPAPPAFELEEDFVPKAVSRRGVLPAGYLSRNTAEQACTAAEKRLCSRDEWLTACRGETDQPFPYGASYENAACNINRKSHPASLLHGDASKNHLDPRLGLAQDGDGPLLRMTGATPRCQSKWGEDAVFDMVGNVDEWIDEPDGSFVGGFYSRGTTSGCAASIDLHEPSYFDYSLGTRCCQQADAPR